MILIAMSLSFERPHPYFFTRVIGSWDCTISIHEAYLDLMKSSWVFKEIVLRKEEYEDLPEKEIIKMMLEISGVGQHFPVRLLSL